MLLSSLLLLTFLLSDFGGPVVVCICAVVGSQANAVILAVASFTTVACIPAIAGIPLLLASL
jgi:hypothetical protein